MNVLDQALHTLGYTAFRPGQREVIEWILQGRDTLFITATGSGKSLTYQMASLFFPGITVVISPLISLMIDQVHQLSKLGIPCEAMHSLNSNTEQERVMDRLRKGELRLIFVAPERFQSEIFRNAIGRQTVSMLCVDEVHCVVSWGFDFRPEYMRISAFHRDIGSPPILGLTATATPQAIRDICDKLMLRQPHLQISSFDRPNLYLSVDTCKDGAGGAGSHKEEPTSMERPRKILDLMKRTPDGAIIVYCATRKQTDQLTALFTRFDKAENGPLGREIIGYHAGMSDKLRRESQEKFVNSQKPLIFATTAFGMGIDRADVRAVVHYQIPGTLEGYYQEIGRAGRDRKDAEAILFYHSADVGLQRWLIKQEAYEDYEYRTLYHAIKREQQDNERDKSGLYHMMRFRVISRSSRKGWHGSWMIEADWDSPQVDALLSWAKEVRERKQAQLNNMLNYVQSPKAVQFTIGGSTKKNPQCLRRAILGYFGEHLIIEPTRCCNVCEERLEKIRRRIMDGAERAEEI